MLILFSIFFSSFVIALSGAMMPGPLLTATISESSRRGFMAGPLMIIGHGILELALVIALLVGLAPVLKQNIVFITVAIAGGAILLWMAAGMIRSLPVLSLSKNPESSTHKHLVISGIILSISNPYWILWWTTIGFGYILQSQQQGLWGVAFFFTGHILADFAWYTAVSGSIARGRQFLTDRLYRGIIATCSVFLIFFAGYFLYAGLQRMASM